MNNDVLIVLNGFLNLSEKDQAEFIDQLREFTTSRDKATFKRDIGGMVRSVDLGPMGSSCKCCGR